NSRQLRWTEELDVIDLMAVRGSNSSAHQGLANSQSKLQQAIDVFEFELLAVIVHKKEPVSAPRNISPNWSNARNFDCDVSGESITRHIRDFHLSALIEMRDNDAYRRLNSMLTGSDAVQVGQRRDHADRAMSTHSQIPSAIEKDKASHTRVI